MMEMEVHISTNKSSTGRTRAFNPAIAQRLAKWHTSKVKYRGSLLLDPGYH